MSDELMELPKGWEWIQLENVAQVIMGQSPPGESYNQTGKGVPLVNGPVEFGSSAFSKTIRSKFTTSPTKMCQEGDLILCVRGSTTGRMNISGFEACIGRGVAALRAQIYQPYLNFVIHAKQGEIYRLGTGSTFPNVSSDVLNKISFPLPPLNEQKRIVAEIEALRERSQKARSTLLAIPELCNKFRQSVLAAAFRGDLTADWREQNLDVEPASVLLERIAAELEQIFNDVQSEIDRADDLIPTSWAWARLKVIVKKIQPGNNFLCPEVPVAENTVGLVKISAVTWGKFNPKETKTVVDSSKVDPNLFIQPGDLLVTRANTLELVGASVVVDEIHYKIMLSDKVWRVDILEVDKNYINFYLRSKDGRKEIESRATGNQLSMRNISQNAFKEIVIAIPPLEEQKEIVRQIAYCFNSIDQIKQKYLETKDYLDHLDRSILAKAFQGELVEQDPNDEPASVLLDLIRVEREQQAQGKAKKLGKKAAGNKL